MSEEWSSYSSYNVTLRAWFVAFGVGVPATFLINDELIKYISPDTGNSDIVAYFLIGAGAQVLMAFVNKTINWCSYYKDSLLEEDPKGFWQNTANIIAHASNWYVIDFIFDLITIGYFACAMWKLFHLIITSSANGGGV